MNSFKVDGWPEVDSRQEQAAVENAIVSAASERD
jgi:hypothetical protein